MEVVVCAEQQQGETDNQPEEGKMSGEEAGLPSRRQGSQEKIGLVT